MDIQNQMITYRLATREIRNKYFSPKNWDYPEWDVIELYNDVKKELFRSLVLNPLSLKESSEGKENENIEVVVASPFAPIMINREIKSGYWDHPCKEVKENVKMNFIDFFDWDQLGTIDNQYVLVKIKEYKENPDIEGRQALIQSQYIKFTKA
ncbi:MAG: hypothetical protein KAR07_06590 [Spirochaetes bacterium]|nr:hypothetical protein [Spirochaetota bacterium]